MHGAQRVTQTILGLTGERDPEVDKIDGVPGAFEPAGLASSNHLSRSVAWCSPRPDLRTQESVANDWAVVVLSAAISTKPIPVRSTTRDELRTVVNSGSAVQVGYGRDRLYLPSIVRDCSVSEGPDNRFFKHSCLTNFGYSGAPILAQIGGDTAVIGINSVGDPQRRTGMACSATQFAKAVAELTQSE